MPPPPPNHAMLAARAFASGKYHEAALHAERALRKAPKDPVLLLMYGGSRVRMSAPAEGLPSLLQSAQRDPSRVEVHCEIATAYKMLDRPAEALASAERALTLDPSSVPAACVKSYLLRTGGRPDEAMAFMEPLFGANPGHAGLAAEFADLCRGLGRREDGIEALRPIVARQDLSPELRRSLAYRLGHLLDEAGRPDEAFRAFGFANAGGPKPKFLNLDRFTRSWSREMLAGMPAPTRRSVTPVLVVGMPRSGTTLTERIIASHPEAGGVGECTLLPSFVGELARLGRPPTEGWMETRARQYLANLSRAAPAARVVADKLPANDVNLGFASRLLPNVRVVHCVRDPRDVCLSCYCQEFGYGLEWSRDLRACARQHKLHEAVMAHWRETLDVPIFEARYERLVSDPEPAARELLEFIGLPFDERCLAFHRSGRHVATSSWAQVTRPLYTTSAGKWRRYAEHLGPLLEELGPIPEEA